jgi:hypothetical protein
MKQEPTMRRATEEPVIKKSDSAITETVESHPAYAVIGASRVSGHAYLFGSDFDHQHYVTVRISGAVLNRSHSRDWTFSRKAYIEVAMSEAQWATFVATPNQGSGVPCTLKYLKGEQIPGLPPPKSRHDQFKAEAEEDMREALEALKELASQIGTLNISGKAKNAILSYVSRANKRMTDSLPFVAKSFGEHVEQVTEKAKIEINAYITSAVNRAGLESLLGGKAPFKMLEQRETDTSDIIVQQDRRDNDA